MSPEESRTTAANPGRPAESAAQPSHGEARETHFERQDNRWRPGRPGRDWLIVLGMILLYLTWTGLVYWLQPGIR